MKWQDHFLEGMEETCYYAENGVKRYMVCLPLDHSFNDYTALLYFKTYVLIGVCAVGGFVFLLEKEDSSVQVSFDYFDPYWQTFT